MSAHAQPQAGDYNIFDLNAPHARWKGLREDQPVFQDPETGYWIVTRHADIKGVFDDWNTFSSDNAQAPMRPMCDAGKQIMKDGGFTWGDYDGATLKLRQNKTDKPLQLPCTPRLKEALDRHQANLGFEPHPSRHILTRHDGSAMDATRCGIFSLENASAWGSRHSINTRYDIGV